MAGAGQFYDDGVFALRQRQAEVRTFVERKQLTTVNRDVKVIESVRGHPER